MSWHASVPQRLLERGAIAAAPMEQLRSESAKTGVPVAELALRKGLASERALAEAQAEAHGLPFVDLATYAPDADAVSLVPEKVARQHGILPLFRIENTITVAMVDPTDILAIDAARGRTGLLIDPVVSAPGMIRQAIDRAFSKPADAAAPPPSAEPEPAAPPAPAGPIEEIVDAAVREGASDIHLEPTEEAVDVRFRIDGVLRTAKTLTKASHASLVSRVKILSNLDIAETRLPQDGRFRQNADGRTVDLRVSCVPTVHGENVVLRVLDNRMTGAGLGQLGLSDAARATFERLLQTPYGLLLVTGPTGSGKTTTLYTALKIVSTPDRHVITIEDPVEYRMPGIRQIQVNDRIGLKFATGLRAVLRQDPDVIMVGEIRDRETAEIAIQSALTGHFVLSTLHTNDAAAAVTRLADMGVDPFLITASLIGVVSQRLVRAVCPDCREPVTVTPEAAAALGVKVDTPIRGSRGKGCLACNAAGYRGRRGLYEILTLTPPLRELIAKGATADALRAAAAAEGMTPLAQDGLDKVRQGITTVEEVLRVTRFS